MRRCDDPRWREACQRVDRAASLLERTRKSVDSRVWEARERWADAVRAWLEGTGGINDAIEASLGFEDSAARAMSGIGPCRVAPDPPWMSEYQIQHLDRVIHPHSKPQIWSPPGPPRRPRSGWWPTPNPAQSATHQVFPWNTLRFSHRKAGFACFPGFEEFPAVSTGTSQKAKGPSIVSGLG